MRRSGREAGTLLPTNRKYLGSKAALAEWICGHVVAAAGIPDSFLDGFAGTGAVAVEMARRGARAITCVDNLRSNTAILGAYFTPLTAAQRAAVAVHLAQLASLPGRCGYVTETYGERYFTHANARLIDAIRERIAELAAAGEAQPVVQALLASLLLGADRAANTLGQYDAYLKHLGQPAHSHGRHLVDTRVYEPIRLAPVAVADRPAVVLTASLLPALTHLAVDVAYFDPPYNSRQYCDNYHVLENLTLWQRPPVSGKTRKFACEHLKSPFSRRREVAAAFRELLDNCRARHLFLSYSSEGLLSADDLEQLLARHGRVERWEYRYPVFGHGAGVARKRDVVEYLFAVRRR